MNRSSPNQLQLWGTNIQAHYEAESEDQGTFSVEVDAVEPAEIGKLLQSQKQQLERFIEGLGQTAHLPVDLRRYTQQILNICDCSSVDDRKVLELANNTIRKQEEMKHRMRNNKRLKRNWNKEDLTILLWVMEHFNRKHNRRSDEYVHLVATQLDSDWKYIASFVPGKNASQCMFKWLGLKKHNLSEYPWTEKEEALLRDLVEKKGKNKWIQISQQLYMQNKQIKTFRSPKQCREHWTCYMDPELKKGPWRPQEDLTLLKEFVRLGKRWSEIAKKLQGRTQNAVKNRFNLLMMKQEKVQGRKRSHEYFSQHWITILEREIRLNPNLMVDSDYVVSEQKQPETLRERTNLPDEYINEAGKVETSAETYMTQQHSRVTVRMDDAEQPEEATVRFVKFKKIPFRELLQLTDLFPAEFNQQSMEITYKNEPCPWNEESELSRMDEDKEHQEEAANHAVSYSQAP